MKIGGQNSNYGDFYRTNNLVSSTNKLQGRKKEKGENLQINSPETLCGPDLDPDLNKQYKENK